MSRSCVEGVRIAGIATCLPPRRVENADAGERFGHEEVRKVVAMAGVSSRRVVDAGTTSADLCEHAARRLLDRLGWAPETIDGLVVVTQTPDHLLPSTSCLLQHRLGLSPDCAAFDVGLGCSGYPYGLFVASAMLRAGGHRRALMLHGETPSRFVDPGDHATLLLFADAGSATALELDERSAMRFCMHTDGSGAEALMIRGGGFRERTPSDPRELSVRMDGAAVFNFTLRRVPELIDETLGFAGIERAAIDVYAFHQSNRFIIRHLVRKCRLPEDRVPLTLADVGNCGGPSVALALTRSIAPERTAPLSAMLLGYGVGLSWASAVVTIDPACPMIDDDLPAVAGAPTERT